MRVYFDTCTLQRPLDDRLQPRILLEAEAILALLAFCDQGVLQLVTSDIVAYETTNNPHQQKRVFVEQITQRATEHIQLTDAIEHLAQQYEQSGIKAVDALHLASAVAANVAYFCTCDDRLYRRAMQLTNLTVQVRTPLGLAQELLS